MYISLPTCYMNFRETYRIAIPKLDIMTSSGIITVENLDSCSRDKVEYSIKISEFLSKARSLNPGKGKILSRTILIQNSTFQVEIFLNGKDQHSQVNYHLIFYLYI